MFLKVGALVASLVGALALAAPASAAPVRPGSGPSASGKVCAFTNCWPGPWVRPWPVRKLPRGGPVW